MANSHSVCPWWIGYLLVCPIRRLFESPDKLLGPFVRPGMTVVEPGCAMGYFSLPIARRVGPEGRVICVDLQEKMITGLLRRARRAGLAERILASVCSTDDLGLGPFGESADLAVAIHVVHEVPDQHRLLVQLHDVLRPGGLLLIVEPPGHVSPEAFAQTLLLAKSAGFEPTDRALSRRGPGAILQRRA
ncbi:MAG TPA: methyltransferase domain-containing protein [Vicinamibacterales bacterium]|nr:methyltransferase domain-containing protein [Vicinamibacterales bacterium]